MSLKKILQAADKAADQAVALEQRNEAAAAADSGASIPQPGNQLIAENLNGLIRRIADVSAKEIDRVILELQGMRNMLDDKGERLSREITGYAGLNHAAMTAMKVIGDSLKQWKGVGPTMPTSEIPADHAGDRVIALQSRAS